ncbi:radical SAM protein [Phaeovibrio sulfidiphilus]|uniref:Radical SAM protein n=1 Tax=Phaeovibrio sulfidiphilus TaxID=1220600 RepID=A0A8J6YJV2_9PROT|nr:radical SAM protein [Phaeovibrio sulfidiphilus]MBE1237731.1 radical SAM protein [Phaeovibrio sulfidiphilus]
MSHSLSPVPPPAASGPDGSVFSAYDRLCEQEGLLPVKVTPFYQRKVEQEVAALGHREGPLYRLVYPTPERLALRVPGERVDFVRDRAGLASGGQQAVMQKYPDRLLFLPTEQCAAHCQYCLRQNLLNELRDDSARDLDLKLEALRACLEARPKVREVIISGGDPLTLPVEALIRVLDFVAHDCRVPRVRLHTRAIAYAPTLFERPGLADALARTRTRVVLHLVHPYEICTRVAETIGMLRDAGVRLYNQFPLLRRVNDHTEVLVEHLELLDDLGVRNLSIFAPDPVTWSASFRLPLARIAALMDELNASTPSWINATRFVFDTPIGKVAREDMRSNDVEGGFAVFEREGRSVTYPDFPAEHDRPGDIATLLWKGPRALQTGR